MLRSILFNIAFFGATTVLCLLSLPLMLLPRGAFMAMLAFYGRLVEGMLAVICGLRVRVIGMENLPPGPVLIASKHQSAFDTVFWLSRLPDPCYVLKAELMKIPVWGWLARHSKMVAVDRDGGATALKQMVRDAGAALAESRQIVIFPEGTRTAPGERVAYQPGVAALASALKVPVVPVATDSGVYWGKNAFAKRPGVLTVSVLPPIPAGTPRAALMRGLEEAIEAETARLLS
jgi:1-acyl-sn-glycerol-3-phosphate acyltransferase